MGYAGQRAQLRELDACEIALVAGGDGEEVGPDIVVVANKLSDSASFNDWGLGGGWGMTSYFSGPSGFGGGGGGNFPFIPYAPIPFDDTVTDGQAPQPGDIVVVAPTLPPGYTWAPGDMGNFYLVNPDGSLVPNSAWALQMCENYTDLQQGLNTTANGAKVFTLAGGPIGAILGGVADFSLWLQQQLGGPMPQWCVGDGSSVYDPTRDYSN